MARRGTDTTYAEAADFGGEEHVPGGTEDLILEEHLQKALDEAEDDTARYHLRAALQRLDLE